MDESEFCHPQMSDNCSQQLSVGLRVDTFNSISKYHVLFDVKGMVIYWLMQILEMRKGTEIL